METPTKMLSMPEVWNRRSWKPSRNSCGDALSGHQDLSSQLWSTARSSAPSENANWEQGLEATRSAASDCMVHQISRMHAAMNQVLSHERARHASEISLILRRVEKDLKDTFHQVGNTVRGLAEKVHILKKQVEAQNKALEEKEFASSQVHPDVHILRQSDQSECLDAHCEDATASFQWVQERELALRDEIAHLRSKLRSYEHGQKGFLPQMAKMSSSWMRHAGKERIPEAKVYDLSALLRKPEAVETEVPITAPSWPARPVAKCKASGEDTSNGPARQTRRGLRIPKQSLRDADSLSLLEKALPPLCLLSDVFSQLRNSGCFSAVTLTSALEMSAADAHSVLSNIVFLFRHAAPKLQGLSSLVLSLQEMSRLHVETGATPPALGRGQTQGVREVPFLKALQGSVHVERHHVEGISVDILQQSEPVGKEPFQTQKLAQMHNHWGHCYAANGKCRELCKLVLPNKTS
ncbi:hypothetical protein AK812_SmicGene25370 [Symbiodinium microadriaticum]|uniref:Uncharacterized protein n=1 Tax=Symbiodinium microadriaticum TaxID=2951 RepID=A0A1Q9DC87_SYMMI|nr:hypothetical protein AK812_SmicGene25370 [Symbiodinium microadriaticum]